MKTAIILGILFMITMFVITLIRANRAQNNDAEDPYTVVDEKRRDAHITVQSIVKRNRREGIATTIATLGFLLLCASGILFLHGWYVSLVTPQKEYYHREVRIETQAKIQPPHQAYVPKAYTPWGNTEASAPSGSSTIAWSPVGNHTFKQKKIDYRPPTSGGANGGNAQNNDLSF